MRDNPIQFAVVREDPQIELDLILARRETPRPVKRALIVASGGCTALALAQAAPEVEIAALDPNPAQLALVARKIKALAREDHDAIGAYVDDPEGLSACGNFESLFRGWRRLIFDLVCPKGEVVAALEAGDGEGLLARLRSCPYWPVAFTMYFHEALLEAMFGPDATQYAPRGSYPAYFQQVVEGGLTRPDAGANPYLHHVLLGHYLPGHAPMWLQRSGATPSVTLQRGDLRTVSFADYDLVQISNVMDWMDPRSVAALATRLGDDLRPDAQVVVRQLNNHRDLPGVFGPRFDFDPEHDAALAAAERSLFYAHVRVGRRR